MSIDQRFTNLPIDSAPPRTVLRRDIVAAVLTGQVAGLIMAVAMVVVFAAVLGRAWYEPVQVIGSFVFGGAALPGHFVLRAFVMGLLIHQLVASFLWSLVFGFAMSRMEATWMNALAAGLGIGVVSQVLDGQLLVPFLMTAFHGHDLWSENVPATWSWVSHLVFGAAFVLFTPIWRALSSVNQIR
jgi:hypothetical protein